ncbi:MAG: hypothetical protein KAW46_01410 [candidate division Zixibacteria bacterium]|nr:hypothetical protein [candidate division Zixibacteria bacterium]
MDLIFEYWLEIVALVTLAVLMYGRPFLSLTNLTNLYWISMVIAGLMLYPVSSQFVRYIDDGLLTDSVRLYLIAFASFALGVFQIRILRVYFGDRRNQAASGFVPDKVNIRSLVPWIITAVSGILIFATFHNVGYIPLLEGETHVTKYFQADLDVFTKYRPIYTFALNALSSILTFSIVVMLFHAKKKRSWMLLAAVTIVIILLTAKRGPLLLPLVYVGLSYSIMKRSIKPLILTVVSVVVIGVVMNLAVVSDDGLLASFLIPLSTSAFVGVRELTRLLTLANGELLCGKTYLAGFLSFIPTEWFEFKANYNYIRYVMNLEGVDPSLSGGMRASYIGEALINFGMLGVVAVSYVFGMVVSTIDVWFFRSRWIKRHGMAGLVLGITIFHLGILAFFENGSSATLFFLNRTAVLWILILICFPSKKSARERARTEIPVRN